MLYKLIVGVLSVMVFVETDQYKIKASKQGTQEDRLKSEIEVYVEEANYPIDEDLDVVRQDLITTLELESCFVESK